VPKRDDGGRADGEPRPALWAAVLADLRLRLAGGEFAERFPTDRELTACYGVSRHTVREAVRRLDMVDRRPRLGGRIRRPPTALETLGRSLRALGVELTVTGTGRGRRRSAGVAAALGAEPNGGFEVLTHLLSADGQPLLASELWLGPGSPLGAGHVEGLLGVGPGDDGIGVERESVLPIAASPQLRGVLHLPAGAAVFCAEQRVDVDGRPAGWHRAFIRPERYRCVVRWEAGSRES
jgi:GntR family transcriptional regulator